MTTIQEQVGDDERHGNMGGCAGTSFSALAGMNFPITGAASPPRNDIRDDEIFPAGHDCRVRIFVGALIIELGSIWG